MNRLNVFLFKCLFLIPRHWLKDFAAFEIRFGYYVKKLTIFCGWTRLETEMLSTNDKKSMRFQKLVV